MRVNSSRCFMMILLLGAMTFSLTGLAHAQCSGQEMTAVFVVSGFVVWKKGFLKMEGLRGVVHREV